MKVFLTRKQLKPVHLVIAGALFIGIISCSKDDDDAAATSPTYSVGGTVSGLSGTVVLQNNEGNDLSITENGSFTFTTALADKAEYKVSVKTQPSNAVCSISSGTGTISAANVTNVAVVCSTSSYKVGGTLSGLSGTVVLQNNAADNLTLTASGSFQFTTAVASGAAYVVTVLTQPSGQSCTVTSGSGTISSADVSSVSVTCAETVKKIFVTAVNRNGNLGGISGADAICASDANKPSGGSTYKAMVVDGSTRVACTSNNCATSGTSEHVNWVLLPSTRYVRASDSQDIGTTTSNGVFTSLTGSYAATGGNSGANRLWTGFDGNWVADNTRDCSNWSVSDTTQGRHARRDVTTSQAIAYSWQNCSDTDNALVCVEQ